MSENRVQDRLAFHFPGFEAIGAAHHHARFGRESERFATLWDAALQTSGLHEGADAASWQVQASGKDWSVSTRLVLMEWCSRLKRPSGQGFWCQVAAFAPRYLAYFLTLAPWRYLIASWRYWLFFAYPLFVFLISAAFASATLAITQMASSMAYPVFAGIVWLATFLIAFQTLGKHWLVPLALDLSHHTHCLALRADAIALARIDSFAKTMAGEIRRSTARGIVVTTHSSGSIYAAAALAKALRHDPQLLDGRSLQLVAIASNLPNLTLMRQCQWLRDDLDIVMGHRAVQWIEVYAHNDPLGFYRFGPERTMDRAPANKVVYLQVRFSMMMDRTRYRKIIRRFFRLHRQLILANDCRYLYDFYLILFGPGNPVTQVRRQNWGKA